MALEWQGHGGIWDSWGCAFPREWPWEGSTFCFPTTPQPWANLLWASLEGGG